tara:strand:- start:18 stop:1319 length:1302 start_codon:yes stop_codon:yes gene_type:complete
MANKKISELSAVTALAETDVLPVVVGGGTTNKVTFQNFLRNAPDGTAAAPSIANVGDQDTGILFPATNSVAVSTGGTQRFVVNGNGNVGIGESSPLTPLHVSSTGDTVVRITSADGNGAFLDLGDASDPDGGRVVYDSGSNLTFSTASTERLRLDSSGRLGLATTTPSTRFHLTGTDNNFITLGHATRTGSWLIEHSGTDSENLDFRQNNGSTTVRSYLAGRDVHEFHTNGSERMRIDSSGVGIGVSSPGTDLDVNNGSANCTIRARTGTGFSSFLSLLPNGDGTGVALAANSDQSAQLFNQLNSHLAFGTNNTERIRVDSSGNALLGGTASPASATKSLAIFNGTAPTGSVTDGVVLYAEDVSSSSELKVRDEAGNVTTLSPHNFDLIPEGPSEDMAWSYYSEKDGKRINVDMLKAVRLLEQLTGEQLVFTG